MNVRIEEGPKCLKCGATSEQLVFGGVGDWRNKIMCSSCCHFWNASPADITYQAARQLGVSEEALRQADDKSQKELEQVLLGGSNFNDLPEALQVARWQARRLALRQT